MVEALNSNWFDPIPLERYSEVVSKASELCGPDEKCPVGEAVGSPALSIRCGPILRFLGSHEDGKKNYRATILVVTEDETSDYSTEPSATFFVGPAAPPSENSKLTLESGSFPVTLFHQEQGFSFWRFLIELPLLGYEQKVKYAINDYTNDYQFIVPSAEQTMNIMSYSCNGFSYSVPTSDFKSSLWLDVLRRHSKLPYHVMIGGGDQIYADSISYECPPFAEWLKHKKLLSTDPLTPEIVTAYEEYYLHHYLKWFGSGYWKGSAGSTWQPMLPMSMAQIPSINVFDDHDIIDGFGSYKEHTMSQPIFKGVGKSAFKYYLLFQQHTSPDEKNSVDKSWIFGTRPGPYIGERSRSMWARLGKEVGFAGFDCRSERKRDQVITRSTYQAIFERLSREIKASNGDIKHLLVLLGVPIAYPRMVWAEAIMSSKLIRPIKYMARKGWIAKGLVNPYDGSIELLDDLNDHWCAHAHKAERNQLVADLTTFGASHGVRITILSGDVHLCGIGRFKTKVHRHAPAVSQHKLESNEETLSNGLTDPRLIFNLISSAIVNAAPPNGMAGLLNSRSKIHRFDRHTDEDVVPIFTHDTDGAERSNLQFLNKRNFADLIPMKNSQFDLSSGSEKNVYPGPVEHAQVVDADSPLSDKKTGRNAPYPIHPNSLIATLHVEKDPKNTESETYDYQLLIPSLEAKQTLADVGVKD
ncbi:unnamed protein product [Kuraishia capsulata CBS 1993]|uniref:PhoD-like phosphatase domain-containing protein n=1 Tax=Kuraishia capsulata CBS 1993 TaxID=1382522 RepID=W6MXU9_9ASCO|nr:uncharacterized protein KUCA_T00005507001 [Kuraishia capsulata CBS 1993]CDK29515.1 unnamed protein product [Kuraishia capsulata CBS 1993]